MELKNQAPDLSHLLKVTELPGQLASLEQARRIAVRYAWAEKYAVDKEVLEVGCGSGFGLGRLGKKARTVVAGDASPHALNVAKNHYGHRFNFLEFNAEEIPLESSSKDLILCFETIYFIQNPLKFLYEAKRVLKPTGRLLIVTCNKDLPSFHRSSAAKEYFGVVELENLLTKAGFESRFFGNDPMTLSDRLLNPLKATIVSTGLMPSSLTARAFLKLIRYGKLQRLPNELMEGYESLTLVEIEKGVSNKIYKTVFCEAQPT